MFLVIFFFALLLMILLRLYVFKSRAEQMYDKIPGPKSYPIIGSLMEFEYPKVDIIKTITNLSFRYGPVFLMRLGLDPVVFIRDPSDVEVILSSTTLIDKAAIYWALKPWLNEGLLTSGGKKWRMHRKILTPAFHFKILERFIPIFVKNSHILLDKLSKLTGKEFDISEYISLCSLDIITETAMGIEVNAQLEESEYVKAVNVVLEIIARRNFSLIERTFLFHMMPSGRLHDKLIAYLHSVTENVMKERKTVLLKNASNSDKELDTLNCDIGIKEKKAFLDLLLEYNNNGAGLTDSEIRQEVDTFMFEGYDTTTSTIVFCLYCLSQNLHVQNKAYKEIQQIFVDSDRDCTYQDMQEMKYLEKVIKETLRCYAAVPFVGRKANCDLELKSGYIIPENSSIFVLIEAMNHDPVLYPEPFKFDPDRFDNKSVNPYAFVPFSAGPRNCIGQKYVMMEIKCVISLILRKFHIIPSEVPVIPWFNIVMKSSTGVYVRFEPRIHV